LPCGILGRPVFRSKVRAYTIRAMNKFALRHVRLWASAVAGICAYFTMPHDWQQLTRVLIGWNTFSLLFLILACIWMTDQSARQISSRYEEEDETAPVILLVVIVAALLSLIAIVMQLASIKSASGGERALHILLAALTVATSWVLVGTMFTLHYADLFYRARSASQERPLAFPKTAAPVFSDFAYFAFTIAAACQTSDVSTAQGPIRRVVLAQTIVSFVFNLAILGFAINVTAGILGN
jgi:uncharacterized membrane protein